MTTAVLEARTTVSAYGWTKLLAPLGGLAIVAGIVAMLVTPAGDDSGETPAELVAYAQTHDGWLVAIGLFGVASIALAGAFVAGVHARLREVATPTESALIVAGGIAFSVGSVLLMKMWAAPLVDMPDEPTLAIAQEQAYLSYDDIGWFVFGAAGVGAFVMAVAASFAAMRAGLPRWLGWLGVVAGILSLGGIAFLGMFAWMAWFTVASVVMLVARGRA